MGNTVKKEWDIFRLVTVALTAATVACLFLPAVCDETTFWFPDRGDMLSDGVEYAYVTFPLKWILAALALLRCGLLLPCAKAANAAALMLGAVSTLWMLVVPWLCRIEQPMGGLAGHDYWLTPFGWLLVACNVLTMVFTIILLNKKR